MAEREGMSRLIADADKFLDELDEEDFNILKYVDPEYALKAEQDNKLKLLPGESLEELTEAEKLAGVERTFGTPCIHIDGESR